MAAERNITDIHFPAEQEANILDEEGLDRLFTRLQPNYVINFAAYTAVDKAEDERELCDIINRV